MKLNHIRNFIFRNSLILFFAIGIFIRIVYSFFFGDPMSGQDALTYIRAAETISKDGLFAEVSTSPYFPIGYSWFLAFIFFFPGDKLIFVELFQILLFCLSSLLFCATVRKRYGRKVSTILAGMLFFSPALISASTQIMYEIPMLSLVMIINRFLLERSIALSTDRYNPYSYFLCGLVGALAATFQPKVLVPLFASILVHAWISKEKEKFNKLTRNTVIISTIGLLLGPLALMTRNATAGDGFALSGNFASNIVVGAQKAGVQIDASDCVDFNYYNPNYFYSTVDTPSRTICFLRAKYENVANGVYVSLIQARNFWLPYVGNLKFQGTWYHGLDFRRFFPTYEYWREPFSTVDNFLGYLWTAFWLFITVFGALRLNQKYGFKETCFWLMPIISLYFVSILTYGESRYRLPVAYSYYFLFAYGLTHLLSQKRIFALLGKN
jgi:hypothetical protein